MTIVAILGIILSILTILGGVVFLGLGGLVAVAGAGATMDAALIAGLSGMVMVFGVAFLVIGIISLIGFIMLLKMKKIGWILVTIFGIISIIMSLISNPIGNIISIVITAIIIIYLYTKRQLFT